MPAEPQQAVKDAASAAKDSVPEPAKDIPNPIQSFFSGAEKSSSLSSRWLTSYATPTAGVAFDHPSCSPSAYLSH